MGTLFTNYTNAGKRESRSGILRESRPGGRSYGGAGEGESRPGGRSYGDVVQRTLENIVEELMEIATRDRSSEEKGDAGKRENWLDWDFTGKINWADRSYLA